MRVSGAAARALPFLAVLLLFPIARSLPAGRPRWLFVLLVAASPLLLIYAAEARAYALLALLDLALFLFVVREPSSFRSLAAITILAVAALATHYLALFFVGSLFVVSFLAGKKRVAAALLAGGVLFLPWLTVLLRQPKEATAWMRESFSPSLFGFASALGGAARIPAPFGPPLPGALLLLGIGAAVAALASLAAGGLALQNRIGAGTVLLTLSGVLAAGVLRPVAFAGRTELAVLPVWLWVLARAAAGSRAARWSAGVIAGIGAAGCLLVLSGTPRAPGIGQRMVERLASTVGRGDSVVATTAFYLRARLAADRGELAGSVEAFPADVAEHPGWFSPRPPSHADYARLSANLSARKGRRVFLLLDSPYWAAPLQEILLSSGRVEILEARAHALLVLVQPR